MQSVPLPDNQVMQPAESQDKKEPSDFESLSPEYKKKWDYILANHPWVKTEESETRI